MMEICEVRDEFLDETSSVFMEDCLNSNLYNITRKYLNEINEIGLDEEGGEFLLKIKM